MGATTTIITQNNLWVISICGFLAILTTVEITSQNTPITKRIITHSYSPGILSAYISKVLLNIIKVKESNQTFLKNLITRRPGVAIGFAGGTNSHPDSFRYGRGGVRKAVDVSSHRLTSVFTFKCPWNGVRHTIGAEHRLLWPSMCPHIDPRYSRWGIRKTPWGNSVGTIELYYFFFTSYGPKTSFTTRFSTLSSRIIT